MFYWLATYLQTLDPFWENLRVMKYITSRSAGTLCLAFLTGVLLGPIVIRVLRRKGIVEAIRKIRKEGSPDLFEMHGAKSGTPTAGGVLIIFAILVPVSLLCDLTNPYVQVLIVITVLFGMLGFWDDYVKIRQSNRGISAKKKIVCQLLIGFGLGLYLYKADLGVFYSHKEMGGNTHLSIPFFKNAYPDLGIFYIPFVMLVIVAASNAVNLTDGLDGLAIGTTIICALAYMIIAYLVTRHDFAEYLIVPYIPRGGEVVVFLAALVGGGLAFLWFNSHPAEVFMGDTGSLTIGGLLGTVALFLKMEILLIIIGGIFVVEALSVIIQVFSYKRFGRRVFLMTPIHHHFERKGLHESKIIIRFWIVTALLALFGLATLKLR